METIILIAIVGAMNVICFFIGAKIGQKVYKGEEIKAPSPIKAVQEFKEEISERADKEIEAINAYNIDNYVPSGLGQRDFD